uniref:Disks large-associated protein 5 n=1 Tax=Anopheles atroparvus TaxID=41427 RepID=A0AAG5DRI7_ANOAO
MEGIKYKGFYKNNTAKRFEEIKAASNRQTKQQREASRHEMRQLNRNISDSEEENAAPVKTVMHQSKHYHIEGSKDTDVPPTDQYQSRLHRLREYQERKQLMQQKQASQRRPFMPYVLSGGRQEESSGVRKKRKPLRELPLKLMEHSQMHRESPVPVAKAVKPRVDCWLRRGLNKSVESTKKPAACKNNPLPIAVVKSAHKVQELKKPISKPVKNFLKGDQLTQPETILFTSTARKHKKPLAFKFDPSSRAVVAKSKNTLAVADADSLFDGISPIDKEPTPKKRASIVLPSKKAHEGDSIWEPQPVAAIHEATAIGCETDVVFVSDSPVPDTHTGGARNRPALNESFTICYDVPPVGGNAEDSIFGCRPIIMPDTFTTVPDTMPQEYDGLNLHASNACSTEQSKPSSPPVLPNKTLASTRRRSSIWSVMLVSPEDAPSPGQENAKSAEGCTDATGPPSAAALSRKRSSLVFTEETLRSVISPSQSNLKLDEVIDIRKCISKRRSSSSSSGPVAIEENDTEENGSPPGPPEEVLAKTIFYYEKVDSELARLQALCTEYAPFLEGEVEMNDHCKGLILAAQGQTNILINKKLTKFRELIGHYKNKWNDRKVRNDDLDGFWLMLSLDLENLDKRFAELRTLRENNWQELEPEPPPKVKKLQGGGGVKKRPKKTAPGGAGKPSSSIAELIRIARQEQLKQKAANIDLGTLTETVTLVKTPTKKSVRIVATPMRQSLRSSLCTGCTPTIVHWEQSKSPASRKRRTIFPEITQPCDSVKSILKTPSVADKRRAKSVLFLDSGLDTPQTRRRQSSRKILDTPKPKIKFNDELEIEHIDNLATRTPSRLDHELEKRRRQSLMLFSATDPDDESQQKEEQQQTRKATARGTPRRTNSVQRRNRSSSRNLSAALWNVSDELLGTVEQEVGSGGKRLTRSAVNNARKKTLDFS